MPLNYNSPPLLSPPPLKKGHPPLSQQPSSKNWRPVKPSLFENWIGSSTPQQKKGVGCTLCYYLYISIEIVNLWKTVLIVPVYRYFHIFYIHFFRAAICDQRKKIPPPPPTKFSIPGDIFHAPYRYLENPACGNIWTEFCWTFISSWIICHK